MAAFSSRSKFYNVASSVDRSVSYSDVRPCAAENTQVGIAKAKIPNKRERERERERKDADVGSSLRASPCQRLTSL